MPKVVEITDENKAVVSSLTAFGITQESIAKKLGISVPTLVKHYQHELETGLDNANAQVANTLFEMATSGKVPSATYFWLKTRAKWRETDKTDDDGSNEVCFTNDLAE
jgi:DNA-binding XRE family transcriptional regulator